MLRDEEPLRDLVRTEVLVEEQQHLELTSGQHSSDRVGDASEATGLAHALEQTTCHASRQGGLASDDSAEEGRDLLRRLGLEEVPGCARSDRGEQVLFRVRCGEDDDLALRRLVDDPRQRGEPVHTGHRQVKEHDVGTALANDA